MQQNTVKFGTDFTRARKKFTQALLARSYIFFISAQAWVPSRQTTQTTDLSTDEALSALNLEFRRRVLSAGSSGAGAPGMVLRAGFWGAAPDTRSENDSSGVHGSMDVQVGQGRWARSSGRSPGKLRSPSGQGQMEEDSSGPQSAPPGRSAPALGKLRGQSPLGSRTRGPAGA